LTPPFLFRPLVPLPFGSFLPFNPDSRRALAGGWSCYVDRYAPINLFQRMPSFFGPSSIKFFFPVPPSSGFDLLRTFRPHMVNGSFPLRPSVPSLPPSFSNWNHECNNKVIELFRLLGPSSSQRISPQLNTCQSECNPLTAWTSRGPFLVEQ